MIYEIAIHGVFFIWLAIGLFVIAVTVVRVVKFRKQGLPFSWLVLASALFALGMLYWSMWVGQGPIDVDGQGCGGGGFTQAVVAIFDLESVFDDPAMQDACGKVGLQRVGLAVLVAAIGVAAWVLALRKTKQT